jgi:glutamate 5-kinase
MSRRFQRPIKRLVIKLGSSQIADASLKVRSSNLSSLASQISALHKKGIEVILVSSGAIVLGMGQLGERVRPKDLASLQARAAIGQNVLMRIYSDLFKKAKKNCAQVLLTWDDFDDRARYVNARNTLDAILAKGVIPVINENDTISTEEIKFGDNDKLSALVAGLVHADLLIILSDVDGFYQVEDGQKKFFEVIKEITKEIEAFAGGAKNANISRGGMAAKLQAIKIATHASIPCVIAHGESKNVLLRIVNQEKVGTLFVEKEEKLLARQHWIAFSAKPKGKLVVDDGAKEALLKGGKSLLLPGIVRFDGHFKVDDVVSICDQKNIEFARGVINYSVSDLHKIEDKKGKQEVVHCDNLVLSQR